MPADSRHETTEPRRTVDASGLGQDSVAVVSQVGPVNREFVEPYPVGRVPSYVLSKIADGLRLVLGI